MVNDILPFDKAQEDYNKLDRNSTDSDDVDIMTEAATALYRSTNLIRARQNYLQGLENWAANEDQRSGLGLPQKAQPHLTDYTNFATRELVDESDALYLLNQRPR